MDVWVVWFEERDNESYIIGVVDDPELGKELASQDYVKRLRDFYGPNAPAKYLTWQFDDDPPYPLWLANDNDMRYYCVERWSVMKRDQSVSEQPIATPDDPNKGS